jgi:hypothetical protein
MKYPLILLFAGLLYAAAADAQVTFTKMDTTLKIGKVGYRVDCRNKSAEVNDLTVRPVGFDGGAREIAFPLHGRVWKAEIDDLNSDGYPDLVLYIYTDTAATFGTVYVFISAANKSITGCILPDAMMDGKINTGYKGHDTFVLMEGNLLQKFPIYKPGDDKDKPTGGTRAVLYQLTKTDIAGDNGSTYKFTLIRTYDTH